MGGKTEAGKKQDKEKEKKELRLKERRLMEDSKTIQQRSENSQWEGILTILENFKTFRDNAAKSGDGDGKDFKAGVCRTIAEIQRRISLLGQSQDVSRWNSEERIARFHFLCHIRDIMEYVALRTYKDYLKERLDFEEILHVRGVSGVFSSRELPESINLLPKLDEINSLKDIFALFKFKYVTTESLLSPMFIKIDPSEETASSKEQVRAGKTILSALYLDKIIKENPLNLSELEMQITVADVEKNDRGLLNEKNELAKLLPENLEDSVEKKSGDSSPQVKENTDEIRKNAEKIEKDGKEISRLGKQLEALQIRVARLEGKVHYREVEKIINEVISLSNRFVEKKPTGEDDEAEWTKQIEDLQQQIDTVSNRLQPLVVNMEQENKIQGSNALREYCAAVEHALTGWYTSALAAQGGFVQKSQVYSPRTLQVRGMKNALTNLSKASVHGPAKLIDVPGIDSGSFATFLKDGFSAIASSEVGQAVNAVIPCAGLVLSGLKYLLEKGDKDKQKERAANSENFLKNM